MGFELEMQPEDEVVICPGCAAETYYLGMAPRFCPHCGTRLLDRSEETEEAS